MQTFNTDLELSQIKNERSAVLTSGKQNMQ